MKEKCSMSFTTHITKMDERPVPKLWLAKPDFTIIERINGFSNLTAKMNYMNENEISFEINSHLYDELTNEQYQNPAINKMRNKYLIKMTYNNQTEWFIIENFSKTSEEKDYVPIVAYYIGSELDKKWVGDIEEIGVTPAQLFNKFLPVVAPNWSVRTIDEKIKDVKREYTTSDASVSTLIEQVCQATDAVVVFHNRDRQFSLIHRDNAGKFKGLKIKEATYLKGFTDEQNSRDLTTRLVLFGKDGLTINSVNPAGTDYVEDFSYYMKPFRRDSDRRVIEHSNYMSDELCHALLDYEEYFTNKAKDYENLTKKYSDLLKEQLEEEFKLTRLMATKQRIEDRIELLKPQGNFIERKVIGDSRFNVKYNTRYFFVIKNNGSTARVTLNNEDMVIPSGEYAYFKLHTPPQVTNEDPQLTQTLKVLSANANLNVVLTTASEADFEEEDIEKLDEKFNIQKYRELVTYQTNIVASVERRLKEYDNQRESINNSLAVDTFFPPHLVKERENFVNWGIWREEDHTDAKALLEDGLRQLKEHNDVERTVNVSLIDFLQSLEDKENWDKLSAGDKIRFSNKVYDAQMEAFISELNIDFDNHDISITLSNIIDLRDKNRGIAQKLASFVSTAGQVNLQKNQLGDQLKKTNQVMALLEGEWDANKRRITAANETVQIDNRGIVITSPTHPNEMLIAVAGLIAISNDGGETFKQAINTRGVVAERLIGKVLIGTELVMENDSGTFRFDNDGVRINASSFHLIADDGEDYFDTLLRKMQQEIITAEERISETIKEERESVESEIEDVTSSLTRYAQDLISALADGMLNEQEIHMLKLQMHMLDADYSQVVRRVLPIIQNHTIDPEIQNQLFTVFSKLEEDYSLLSDFIKALDTPTKVPQETIENIMNMLYRFKPAIEELVSMVETALENSEQNRIANAEYNMKKFTEVLKDDLNNEISDLKDSLSDLNEGLEDALSDGIITMVEKSQLSDALMRLESEKKDIDNRFHNTHNHKHLVNTFEKTTLEEAKGEYNSKFSILVSKIMQILNLESVPHSVIEEYKEAYGNFTQTIVTYSDAYEKAWEYITKGYADDARSQANKYTDGLRMEVEADIQDIQGSVSTFREDVYGAFKDGIITEQERNRLGIHHDMLEKEKSDLIQRYDTIITSDYLRGFYDVEGLVETRSLYGQVHADLLLAIELAMMDSKITPEESKEATRLFELYVQRLTDFSRELELAIAALGESKAVAHTNEQLKDYMSLTVFNDEIAQLQAVIDGHITTWYYDYVPTLNNIPAKEWTDTKTKDAHVGDLFYYGTEGTAYRFMKNGTTYEWVLIKDTEVTKALKDAQDAVDLADAKRRVFVAQPTPPYDIGDLWITSSGELMRAAVKKGEGAIYTHNDWIKATKYTDDTKANQVGNLLNSYKESNNLEIKDLKESLGAFKQTVEGAFKDGIVAEYEVKILQTQLQSLDREKADVDAGYNQLLNHPSLTGAPKTRLQNAYTNFSETHNSLKTTINNVIKDGVITKEEYESTMALLNSYPTVLNTYMTIMNETYLHLIKLAEATADDAKEVAERLDSWKSTSFETDVEGIFSRTGSSTWTSTWRPEVDRAIKDSVDGIEVGGRNLLVDSINKGTPWDTPAERNLPDPLGSNNAIKVPRTKIYGYRYTEKEKNKFYPDTYTFSFYIKASKEVSIKIGFRNGTSVITESDVIINETWQKIEHTFTTTDEQVTGRIYYLDLLQNTPDFDVFTAYEKLERGNKATDWSPAPEDVEKYTDDAISNFYDNTIKTNYITSTQSDTRFARKAYESNVDTLFQNIATYKNDYSVKTSAPQVLKEADGSSFKHPFSYEVTARVAGVAADNLVVGVFLSTNKGTKWELEILEQKGQSSYHPELFIDTNGRPSIRLWSHETAFRTVEVVYTKYAGDITNFKRAQSLIDQTAESINLEVKKKVGNDEIISKINQSAEKVSIDANKIALTGNDKISLSIKDSVDNIQIGGRNLLKDSGKSVSNGSYNITRYDLTDKIKENEEVTLTIWGSLAATKSNFRVYNSGGSVFIATLTDNGDGTYSRTFKWRIGSSTNTYLNVYAFTNAQSGTSTINKIKLEYGNKATDWTPAPEDKVDKTRILSEIELSKENVKISGSKINLVGDVNMVNGKTTIKQAVINSGHIKELSFDKLKGGTARFGGSDYNGAFEVYDVEDNPIMKLDYEQAVASELSLGMLNVEEINSDSVVSVLRNDRLYKIHKTTYAKYPEPELIEEIVESDGGDEEGGGGTVKEVWACATLLPCVEHLPKNIDSSVMFEISGGANDDTTIDISGFRGNTKSIIDFHFKDSGTYWYNLRLRGNSAPVRLYGVGTGKPKIVSSSTGNGIYIANCHFTIVNNIHFNGRNDTNNGIRVTHASNVYVTSCIVESYKIGIYSNEMGRVYVTSTKGHNSQYGYRFASGSILSGNGTAPDTALTGDTTGLSTTSGAYVWGTWKYPTPEPNKPPQTIKPTPPPPKPKRYTKVWETSSARVFYRNKPNAYTVTFMRDYPIQGNWGDGFGFRDGAWYFGTGMRNTLRGKKIIRVRVSIGRSSANSQGYTGKRKFSLRMHKSANKPASSNNTNPTFGSGVYTGTLAFGERKWFDVTSTFGSSMASGSWYGFGVKTDSSSKSEYMALAKSIKVEVVYE